LRIKKIELIGFKSFKDRTVIQFDSGITGIVGPNGCGKSNIVDALLWVMGEMSAKDLRGASMIDVIFAGAEGFAPAGMAEVSLTLENDGGPFPIKYQKFSEVMATRRLYRNGESEYFINKEPARLRDIQEIFMDTGAGSKGFSIIQQGMIGRIITSKPEERRMLIEEAAGITKFKARKKESQRKLQTTDQNLLRLADIIGELNRQIESLKRQSEKAERYRNIKNQIEDLDLKVASLQFKGLLEDVSNYSNRVTELQDLEFSVETNVQEKSAQVEVLKLHIKELENQVDEVTRSQSEKQTFVQKLELEIQRLQFDIEQAKTKGEMTGSMIQVQQLRAENLTRDFDQYQSQVESLSGHISDLDSQYQEHSEVFREQEYRDAELDEALTNLRRELFALGQTESQIEARVQAGISQIEEIEARLSEAKLLEHELQSKEQELEDRFQEFQNEFQYSESHVIQLKQEFLELESKKQSKLAEIDAAKKEWESFKLQHGGVSSRLGGLEDLDRNFEGFEEGVKQVILWNKNQTQLNPDGQTVFQTLSEVVEVSSDYEVALEAALGHRLQMLLAPETADVIGAVAFLKTEKKGRASFAIPERLKKKINSSEVPSGVVALLNSIVKAPEHLSQIVRSILGQVAVVESVAKAIELKAHYQDWTFVTIEGDILSQDGVLTAGFSEGAESGILKRRREIKELHRQKEEWAGKVALSELLLQKLEAEKLDLDAKVAWANKSWVAQDQELSQLRKELDRAEIELHNIRSTVERAQRESARISEQLTQALAKNEQLNSHKIEITERKQGHAERAVELQSELDNLRLGFSSLREKVTHLQITLSEKKAQFTSAKQNFERVSDDLNVVQTELSRMNAETEQVGFSLNHNQVLLEEKRHHFQTSARELENLRTRISILRNQYEEVSSSLQAKESEYQALQVQANKRLHEVNEAQIRFEQAKMKEQVLIEQIRERYMLNLPDVWLNHFDSHLDLVETESNLKGLKERLSKIGEVNLSAIEEYRQTGERYEFLTAQQSDLVEAKEQLRRVIDRINRICSKRFKDTFDLVNERFTKVFPVLFGGGEARLELVEDPDRSEVGIDIIAKPPGKKMQNVSLLSGGEKALTAVSLVFAIFLVKPSPYCLLDEVDAPLDDANVSRFNDLVREMSKRSQIIVVTHNKHTMEIASKLYGVTMQNRGVSTMVSVNLNDLS